MPKFPKTPPPEPAPEPPPPEPTVDDLLKIAADLVSLAANLIPEIHAAYPAGKAPEGAPDVEAERLFAPLGMDITSFYEAEHVLNDSKDRNCSKLHAYIAMLELVDFPLWRWLRFDAKGHGGGIWMRTELGHVADGKPLPTTALRRKGQAQSQENSDDD